MTGDLRAALEMLRPHLGPGADQGRAIEAFRAAAIVWCNAIEADETRRAQFEARVTAQLASFENRLQERRERNLRIRVMRLAIDEIQTVVTDTRLRAGLPVRVFEIDTRRHPSLARVDAETPG